MLRESLLDRILMGAGERRVHEVAAVGVPLVNGNPIAVLDGSPHRVDVREVDHRVNALRVQIQGQRHQIDVAGPLTIAEQAALDRCAPASTASSAQATPVPRSLCGCTDRMTDSRRPPRCRCTYSI